MINLDLFKKEAEKEKANNKALLNQWKKHDRRKLDDLFHSAHDEVFDETDCLKCANCCKTTSPIFYEKDVERISKRLRMRPSSFIEMYLKIDEDNDFVLKEAPCPFLDSENYCLVYEDRPTACKEYPHTNRKKMFQLLDLTYKNTFVCPAVLKIIKKVKDQLR